MGVGGIVTNFLSGSLPTIVLLANGHKNGHRVTETTVSFGIFFYGPNFFYIFGFEEVYL